MENKWNYPLGLAQAGRLPLGDEPVDEYFFEFKREHVKVQVHFAYSPRITACVIQARHSNGKINWEYVADGVAKLHPKDSDNKAVGRHVAFKRAYSALAVLYFRNTAQHFNMSLGDVYHPLRKEYSHEYWDHFKSIETKEKSNEKQEFSTVNILSKSERIGFIGQQATGQI